MDQETQDPGGADAVFEGIAADLSPRGAVTGNMFGARGLKRGGKAFVCLRENGMMAFRLGADTAAHAEALALPGAHPFDPSGRDRPFKDWVEVPGEQAAHWPHLAESALDYLEE
jgi:hypothetical protein